MLQINQINYLTEVYLLDLYLLDCLNGWLSMGRQGLPKMCWGYSKSGHSMKNCLGLEPDPDWMTYSCGASSFKRGGVGLVKPCAGSNHNTQSWCAKVSVLKADKSKYWLVHDLTAVNDWPAEVPNPHTLLTNVPPDAKIFALRFSVFHYLKVLNIFFCFDISRQTKSVQGKQYMLVVVDHFSCKVEVTPSKDFLHQTSYPTIWYTIWHKLWQRINTCIKKLATISCNS